jgi:hypothetical protein
MQDYTRQTLYIQHKPEIPSTFQSLMVKLIRFRNGLAEYLVPAYSIQTIRPRGLATTTPTTIIIPRNSSQHQHDFRFPLLQNMFLACVKLVHVTGHNRQYPSYPPLLILIGYDNTTGRSWCRSLEVDSWPDISAPADSWQLALQHHNSIMDGNPQSAMLSVGSAGSTDIKMSIAYGLYEDQLCLMVDIDGLLTEPIQVP